MVFMRLSRLLLLSGVLAALAACNPEVSQDQTLASGSPSAPPSETPSEQPTETPSEQPSASLSASPSAEASELPEAGSASFQGQILSQSQGVNRALITLEPGFQQTWSYNQGNFKFDKLSAGDYTLHIDGDGYTSRHLKIQVTETQDAPLQVELFPALKTIVLSPEVLKVFMGQSLAVEGNAQFQDGSTSRNLKWQVTDPSVAQVDDKGVITGLKAGKTSLKVATLESETWQKEVPLEIVRYVFDLIGPGRMSTRSRVRVVADPPADAAFEGAQFTWSAKPAERVKLTPHPAVPNIVIVEALSAGEVEIQALLAKDDLRLDSKKILISIEN